MHKLKYYKFFIKDFIILLVIIVLPFMFFTYNLIAYENDIWYSELFSFDLESLKDLEYSIWIFYIKILTLSILCLWYLTCIYKWKYAIFFPIVIEIYKIHTVIGNLKYGELFESNILESLVFSIPFIFFLVIFSKKAGFRYKVNSHNITLNSEINKQLEEISTFSQVDYKKIKFNFKKLEQQKTLFSKKEYLTKLIQLRDQLSVFD